jgi:hypothetical protein
LNPSEISNYFKKSKTSLSNYAAPLGRTDHKQKFYLKKLNDRNDNTRFAASKAGSTVGGLICGMHTTPKEEALDSLDEQDDLQEPLDPTIEEPEDQDEITFIGDTESQFFNQIK